MLRRKKTRIDAAFWRIDKSSGAGAGTKQTVLTIAGESSSIYNFPTYPKSYPHQDMATLFNVVEWGGLYGVYNVQALTKEAMPGAAQTEMDQA